MRHRKHGRYFNRTASHRRAMFYNLSKNLIKHEVIQTTLAKAKELRMYIEPLITLAKKNTIVAKRRVFSRLKDKKNVHKLFNVIAKRCINRPGGYIRILKCRYRVGDAATIAVVEFVDKM